MLHLKHSVAVRKALNINAQQRFRWIAMVLMSVFWGNIRTDWLQAPRAVMLIPAFRLSPFSLMDANVLVARPVIVPSAAKLLSFQVPDIRPSLFLSVAVASNR